MLRYYRIILRPTPIHSTIERPRTQHVHDNNLVVNVLVSFNYLVRLDYRIYSECRHRDSIAAKIVHTYLGRLGFAGVCVTGKSINHT